MCGEQLQVCPGQRGIIQTNSCQIAQKFDQQGFMAVGPGGVPAGIDPSLLTSAAFELVQVIVMRSSRSSCSSLQVPVYMAIHCAVLLLPLFIVECIKLRSTFQ